MWIWLGIAVSLFHSGLFSGLNLGLFGTSRLRLEILADMKDQDAARILSLRQDVHFLLATVLWGNVASIVLITLFTESVMAGLWAFLFSTFGVTIIGEILPQAYFARHALRRSTFLVPIVRFYQLLLYPLAKPSGLILDLWLGKEEPLYFNEQEIQILLRQHAQSSHTNVDKLESMGAANFLALDDTRIREEGQEINPKSVIKLPTDDRGLPVFPEISREAGHEFLQQIHLAREKWVVITNEKDEPVFVLDADQFLRDAVYTQHAKSIYIYCHRPLMVNRKEVTLGEILPKFTVKVQRPGDDVVDKDILLYWEGKHRRIITGADILGRLLRGIVPRTGEKA